MKHQTPEEKQARLEAAREFQKKNYRIPYCYEGSPLITRHGDPEHPIGGYSMKPEAFEELTGLVVNPKTWDFSAIGQRIMVVMTPELDRYGDHILIPDTANTGAPGLGWVVAAGSTCNKEMPIPGVPEVTHPAELIGMHYLLNTAGGQPLQLNLNDSNYDSPARTATPRDLFYIDIAPWRNSYDLERGDE